MSVSIYLATDMIYSDKKSYLFDNLFQSVQGYRSVLDFFYQSKKNSVSTYVNLLTTKTSDDFSKEIQTDGSLLRIKKFTRSQAEEILRFDASTDFNLVKNGFEQIYENLEIYKKYKTKESFLRIENDVYLAEIGLKSLESVSGRFVSPVNKAPRLVFCHSLTGVDVYCFEFLVDEVFENFFSSTPYDIFLIGEKGNLVYHNKPYRFNSSYAWLVKNYKKILGIESSSSSKSGVREFKVEDIDLIGSYFNVDLGANYFILGLVKQSDAFTVTKMLILKTILVSLAILALLNILSLFLADSISSPLNDLSELTQKIASGDFKARIKAQKILELETLRSNFNKMIEQVVLSQNKLKEYNKLLEFKVEERTKDLSEAKDFISTVIDSLDQGLIVFDREGNCQDIPSKACKTILGESAAQKKFVDVLKVKDVDTTLSWIDAMFDEVIPFESMKELGPTELKFGDSYKNDHFKYVTLDYFSIRDEEEKVKNIVALASDKTKEFKSSKLLEEQTGIVKFVSKLMANKEEFKKFCSQFTQEFQQMKQTFSPSNEDSVKDYLRLLHSFKGSCGLFALTKISSEIHEIETYHQESRDYSNVEATIDKIFALISEAQTIASDFIGEESTSVPDTYDHYTFYLNLENLDQKAALLFRQKYLKISYKDLFKKYDFLLSDLAKSLGKKVKPLVFNNDKFIVDYASLYSLSDSCIHVFRNAIDHGIETPDERLAEAKDEFALITLNCYEENDHVCLSISDDGRGIRADRVRKKMKDLGYPETEISLTDDKIIYHIFDPEFSTADEVTELSGRGVGLYDIKKLVEAMNGQIIIETAISKGTTFTFKFPKDLVI